MSSNGITWVGLDAHKKSIITEVHPPQERDEALRDLCRGRDTVRQDLMRARHRMSKFLLRRGCQYRDSQRHWGVRHMAWLRPLTFAHEPAQVSFDHYLLTIDHLDERLRQMDLHLGSFGDQEPYCQPVAWLRCFRGIDTVTAVSLVAELHDFRRFRSARALMGLPRTGSERTLERRTTAPGPHHPSGQRPRPASAGRGGLAPSASPGVEPALAPATRRPAGPHRRHGARAGRLSVGRALATGGGVAAHRLQHGVTPGG